VTEDLFVFIEGVHGATRLRLVRAVRTRMRAARCAAMLLAVRCGALRPPTRTVYHAVGRGHRALSCAPRVAACPAKRNNNLFGRSQSDDSKVVGGLLCYFVGRRRFSSSSKCSTTTNKGYADPDERLQSSHHANVAGVTRLRDLKATDRRQRGANAEKLPTNRLERPVRCPSSARTANVAVPKRGRVIAD
jgi:hypothetical protein